MLMQLMVYLPFSLFIILHARVVNGATVTSSLTAAFNFDSCPAVGACKGIIELCVNPNDKAPATSGTCKEIPSSNTIPAGNPSVSFSYVDAEVDVDVAIPFPVTFVYSVRQDVIVGTKLTRGTDASITVTLTDTAPSVITMKATNTALAQDFSIDVTSKLSCPSGTMGPTCSITTITPDCPDSESSSGRDSNDESSNS